MYNNCRNMRILDLWKSTAPTPHYLLLFPILCFLYFLLYHLVLKGLKFWEKKLKFVLIPPEVRNLQEKVIPPPMQVFGAILSRLTFLKTRPSK